MLNMLKLEQVEDPGRESDCKSHGDYVLTVDYRNRGLALIDPMMSVSGIYQEVRGRHRETPERFQCESCNYAALSTVVPKIVSTS